MTGIMPPDSEVRSAGNGCETALGGMLAGPGRIVAGGPRSDPVTKDRSR